MVQFDDGWCNRMLTPMAIMCDSLPDLITFRGFDKTRRPSVATLVTILWREESRVTHVADGVKRDIGTENGTKIEERVEAVGRRAGISEVGLGFGNRDIWISP